MRRHLIWPSWLGMLVPFEIWQRERRKERGGREARWNAYTPNFIWMCSLCRLPVAKNHNFEQILSFGKLLYWPSFTDEGQMWCARVDSRSTLRCQISSRPVYFVVLWRRNPKFYHFIEFGIFWCRQLATIWESWTRLHNHEASPIQRYQNRFCTPTHSWKNRLYNLWRSKAWRTVRQTKKVNAFEASEIRALPNLARW